MEPGFVIDARGLDRRQGSDPATLPRQFGANDGPLPLWIAEPNLDLAVEVTEALQARAATGWYGYEMRPQPIIEAFWAWTADRHRWDGTGLRTVVSPSVLTPVGAMIEQMTDPVDGSSSSPRSSPGSSPWSPQLVAGRCATRSH